MKTLYRYVGEAPINGVTLRDGTQTMLVHGCEYLLDSENEYVRALLAKRDANGMPRPWLVPVSGDAPQTTAADGTEEQDDNDNSSSSHKKGKR